MPVAPNAVCPIPATFRLTWHCYIVRLWGGHRHLSHLAFPCLLLLPLVRLSWGFLAFYYPLPGRRIIRFMSTPQRAMNLIITCD